MQSIIFLRDLNQNPYKLKHAVVVFSAFPFCINSYFLLCKEVLMVMNYFCVKSLSLTVLILKSGQRFMPIFCTLNNNCEYYNIQHIDYCTLLLAFETVLLLFFTFYI